jgi:chromosome segregation ATPase
MGRFFAAIRRWFNFYFLRRSEDVRRSADEQFTGSVEGIRAAYAIDRDKLASDFRGLQEAVGQVLTVVEDKKIRLERLDAEEKTLQTQLNGSIRAAEKAQAESNTEEFAKAQAAYSRYKARMTEIDGEQQRLSGEVASLETSIQSHMSRLTEFQARLEALPAEEAATVADYVSAKQIIELNNRLMNASDSLKEGPTATVREQVRQMSAQARITEKLAGTDVTLQDRQYAELGRDMEGADSLEAVLAARKAQRQAAEGGTPVAEAAAGEAAVGETATGGAPTEPNERPRI